MNKKENILLSDIQTYKSSFSIFKWIFIITIIILTLTILLMYINFNTTLTKYNSSVWIMDKTGDISSANLQQQDKSTRIYEYKDHVKDFFKLWYELDAVSYKVNTELALNLVESKTANILYSQYIDAETSKKLAVNNVYTTVVIDSILFNTKTLPVEGIIYGKQTFERTKAKVLRNLICTFNIYDINRSEVNPHGALISNWKIIDTRILESIQKEN